jgi:hypothetical protein
MDSKKQELSPELKQVYERVMNTQVAKDTAAPGTPATSAPQTPAPAVAAPSVQTQPSPQPSAAPTPAPTIANLKGTTAKGGSKSMLSGKVIGLLVVVLLAVWGVFWAKLFGMF